ncbi:hypothetical protein VPH35_001901 [Triticum aestivum]
MIKKMGFTAFNQHLIKPTKHLQFRQHNIFFAGGHTKLLICIILCCFPYCFLPGMTRHSGSLFSFPTQEHIAKLIYITLFHLQVYLISTGIYMHSLFFFFSDLLIFMI